MADQNILTVRVCIVLSLAAMVLNKSPITCFSLAESKRTTETEYEKSLLVHDLL